MACVAQGLSRQETHEEIRKHLNIFSLPYWSDFLGVLSHQAADNVKKHGKDNDLIDRIKKTDFFKPILDQLDFLLDPKTFVGRAPQQVEKFTGPGGEVATALEPYANHLKKAETVDLHV